MKVGELIKLLEDAVKQNPTLADMPVFVPMQFTMADTDEIDIAIYPDCLHISETNLITQ